MRDRFLRPAVADVVRHRLVVGSPGNVDGAGHDQHVLRAQIAARLRDLAGQFQPAGPLRRVVARQRIGPEQERAQAADGDADLLGHAADCRELLRSGLGREVVVEVVVQFDAVEAGVLRELQALFERHLLRIGERPEVDRLLESVLLPRRRGLWLRRHGGGAERGGTQSGGRRSEQFAAIGRVGTGHGGTS